jgi:transmembrane sensor
MSGPDHRDVAASPEALEAAEWCLRLHEDDLGEEQEARLREWLQGPGNRAALERALAVWELTAPEGLPAQTVPLRLDALAHVGEAGAARSSFRWTRFGAAAAGLVALLAAALILLMPDRPQIYETGRGERRVVVLADGSRLSMDASSRVEVAYDEERRSLHLLNGRARFDVRSDPLRPFSVRARDRLVVARGTSFSVELLSAELRVVLYEGRVAVIEEDPRTGARHDLLEAGGTGAGQLDLRPGRELTLAVAREERPRIAEVDLVRSASWEAGQLVFDEEPLLRAVEIVNRYSSETLVLGDGAAGAVRISGVFTTGDTASFIEGVTGVFPVRAVRSGDRILLFGAVRQGRGAFVLPQNGE